MFNNLRLPWCGFITLLFVPSFLYGENYLDEIGYTRLSNELGGALPDGSGVEVVQVEAATGGGDFTCQAVSFGANSGSGNYSGKTLDSPLSSSGASWHAGRVADLFFGNRNSPTSDSSEDASMTPGVTSITLYTVNDWIEQSNFNSTDRVAGMVQSHAWVSAPADETTAMIEELENVDYEAYNDGTLISAGLNNGSGTSVPVLYATAYNVIGVGLTNGGHSRGTTSSGYGSGGRQAVQLVTPMTTTSWSTGVIASACSLLRGVANDEAWLSNARSDLPLKAILYASATKDEFASWSNTSTSPLDAVYGAGELNVYRAYHLLMGPEATTGTSHNTSAWQASQIPGSLQNTYEVVVSEEAAPARLTVALVWNRPVNRSLAGPFWNRRVSYSWLNMADLSLRLVDTSDESEVSSSDSTVDNVEYLYEQTLAAGTYRIEVNGSSSGTEYGLAWALDSFEPCLEASVDTGGAQINIDFSNLLPEVSYTLEESTDLVTWSDTAAIKIPVDNSAVSYTEALSGSGKFFRLKW